MNHRGRHEDKRMLLVDDHAVFRLGIRALLAQTGLPLRVHEAESVLAALEARATAPGFDLILYDWHYPDGGGGVKGLVALCQLMPGVPVLVMSADEDEAIRIAAVKLGAFGYVPKTADPRAIRDLLWRALNAAPRPAASAADAPHACSGGALTSRQGEVLHLMARGDANKQIADQLRIAETTVRAHVSDILRVLNARNRTEAVVRATRMGLV